MTMKDNDWLFNTNSWKPSMNQYRVSRLTPHKLWRDRELKNYKIFKIFVFLKLGPITYSKLFWENAGEVDWDRIKYSITANWILKLFAEPVTVKSKKHTHESSLINSLLGINNRFSTWLKFKSFTEESANNIADDTFLRGVATVHGADYLMCIRYLNSEIFLMG